LLVISDNCFLVVVQRGSIAQTVQASLPFSYLWEYVHILSLTTYACVFAELKEAVLSSSSSLLISCWLWVKGE
jgi:hypothetical protein